MRSKKKRRRKSRIEERSSLVVDLPPNPPKVRPKAETPLRRVLFIPDSHWPYVDRRAFGIIIKAIKAFKPHAVVILGDFGDFYCASRHTKNPNRTRDLKVEADACNEGLDLVDAACEEVGCEDKRFIKGNHEDMLERYLAEKAPELFNLVSVDALFMLKARGYKVTPYKDFDHTGKLVMTHEVGYAGKDAHIRSAADTGSNTIIGHTHRLAVYYANNILGKHQVAIMSGWLGDKKAAEYMYRSKTKDWALGFSIGYQEPNGTVHMTPVPIIDYRCIIEGKLIR